MINTNGRQPNSGNLGVATGNNRTNSSGNFAAIGPLGRTSIIYPVIVPAGAVVAVPAAGTNFYVTIATGAIDIRPLGGVFNTYYAGKGLKLQEVNAFSALEVKNPNPFQIIAQLFIGFDEYIDNTLIISQTGQELVAYPTYPTANAAAQVNITDLAGGAFDDVNGDSWLAIQREAIYIFNVDAGVTLLLQRYGSVTANDLAVAAIYPTTSLRYAASGSYTLSVGGGNINCIVSELYQAIPAAAS